MSQTPLTEQGAVNQSCYKFCQSSGVIVLLRLKPRTLSLFRYKQKESPKSSIRLNAAITTKMTFSLSRVSVLPQWLLGQRTHQELKQGGVKRLLHFVLHVRNAPDRHRGGSQPLYYRCTLHIAVNTNCICHQSTQNIPKHDQNCSPSERKVPDRKRLRRTCVTDTRVLRFR